jgi:hypothetical protein
MNKELKDNAIIVYEQKKIDASSNVARLTKLRDEKIAEYDAVILSINKNILYENSRLNDAEKFLLALSKEKTT